MFGRPRRIGAATEPADGRVQDGRPRFERGERVGVAGVARVVHVDAGGAGSLDERLDLARRGHAYRVCEDELGRVEPTTQVGDATRIDPSLEGAAEGDAQRD